MHFRNLLFKIGNFTFIMLTVILSIFYLGKSFEKLSVWKSQKKVWKYIFKIVQD